MITLKPVCLDCKVAFKPDEIGACLVQMAGDQPYAAWSVDIYKCPGCAKQITFGNGNAPVRMSFEPDFDKYINSFASGMIIREFEKLSHVC